METGEQPQTGPGQSGSTPTTPFEVVRRAEFVFEPFMGSLIQIPEVKMQQAQSSEFFLAQSSQQVGEPKTSAGVGAEEGVVWEKPSAVSKAGAEENVAAVANLAASARKLKKEEEGPRFYQPKHLQFFDPAAAEVGGEGGIAPEEVERRPSIQLPAELKAAILQIDEQRRRKQEEDAKPVKEKKRGLLKAREKKKAEAQETPGSILGLGNTAAQRTAGWEEIEMPRETVGEPIPVEPSATTEDPVVAMKEATPVEEAVPTEAVPIWEAIPAGEAVPTREGEVLAHRDSDLRDVEEALREPEFELTEMSAEPAAEAAMSEAKEEEAKEEEEPAQLPVAMADTLTSFEDEEENAAESTLPIDEPMLAMAEPTLALVELKAMVVKETAGAQLEPEQAAAVEADAATVGAPIVGAPAKVLEFPRQTPIVEEPEEFLVPETVVEEPEILADEEPRKKARPKLAARLQRWFMGEAVSLDGNRRRAERTTLPGLVAFYWSGGTPRPHEIVNISKTGFYLRTNDLWSVDTLVRMTIARPERNGAPTQESISVLARVVRIDEGGVGHEFVTTEALRRAHSPEILPGHGTDAKELDRFLQAG